MNRSVIPHSRPWITDEDFRAIETVMRCGMIAQGALVEEFEREAPRYLGVKGGVATASGTAALILSLRALGVRPGSQVVLPTYVCRSVLEAVLTVGAEPVLCDVGAHWVMTEGSVRPHLTSRTAAIIAVHIFGLPVDVGAMNVFGLPVIEDACQAFGLSARGKSAGTLGATGVLSFHATKCFTSGEGGMLVSDDEGLLAKAKAIRDGSEFPSPRLAAPLSDLQAALGLSQLSRYSHFLERRTCIRELYHGSLSNRQGWTAAGKDADFLFRFPVRTREDFAKLQERFSDQGIHVRRGVDELLHRVMGLPDERFPNGCRLFRETISIPYYPGLTPEECDRVCEALAVVEA